MSTLMLFTKKGDAAGVEAYLTGIANSTYEEGGENLTLCCQP